MTNASDEAEARLLRWLGHSDARQVSDLSHGTAGNRTISLWLGHADARQVSDLPHGPFSILRSVTAGRRPSAEGRWRFGKSETYRASEWQSHSWPRPISFR